MPQAIAEITNIDFEYKSLYSRDLPEEIKGLELKNPTYLIYDEDNLVQIHISEWSAEELYLAIKSLQEERV